jgi:hypothetical protein
MKERLIRARDRTSDIMEGYEKEFNKLKVERLCDVELAKVKAAAAGRELAASVTSSKKKAKTRRDARLHDERLMKYTA